MTPPPSSSPDSPPDSSPAPSLCVYSHPRSGTHYLGCALARNFALDVRPIPIDWDYFVKDPPRFLTPDGPADQVPWGSLVAHEAVHRFEEHVPANRGCRTGSPRLYVYRHCYEVVRSMYLWRFQRNHQEQALLSDEDCSFVDFLRRPLGWQESVHVKAERDFTPVEHWAYHVSGWLDSDALCVSFEDLRRDYDGVLEHIGRTFDLSRTGTGPFDPVPCRVGYVTEGATTLDAAEEEEARALVQETLAQLAPVYPAAAREVDAPAAVDPVWVRHGVPLHRHQSVARRLERELAEERRDHEQRVRELTAAKDRLTRDLRATEGLLERRQAAFRDYLGRIWNLAED